MAVFQISSSIPYDSNIYLLVGRSAILIDAGTGLDSQNVINQIWSTLDGVRLSAILLTHCHADHTGGLADLLTEFGCPAYISESDLPYVTGPDQHVTFADGLDLDIHSVECKKLLATDEFDIGEHHLSVIPTPGHTAGCVCFYDHVTGSLFSGDTVFARGFGRTDLPTGSAYQMYESLNKLRNVNIGTLYPGHGSTTDNGNQAVADAITMMEMYQ